MRTFSHCGKSFFLLISFFDNLPLQLYFVISTITVSAYLYEERNFLMGLDERPTEKSFIGSTSCEFALSFCRENFFAFENIQHTLN